MIQKLLFTIIIVCLFINCLPQMTKYGLSYKDYRRVKIESVNGGELDYNSKFVQDSNQIYSVSELDRLFNKNEFAALQWGLFVSKMGVVNPDSLVSLYKEIYGDSITERTEEILKLSLVNKFFLAAR